MWRTSGRNEGVRHQTELFMLKLKNHDKYRNNLVSLGDVVKEVEGYGVQVGNLFE